MRRSRQYQRSRKTSASATKKSGTARASASSGPLASSKLTVKVRKTPSSSRMTSKWVRSASAAAARRGNAAIQAAGRTRRNPATPSARSTLRRRREPCGGNGVIGGRSGRGLVLFEQGEEEAVRGPGWTCGRQRRPIVGQRQEVPGRSRPGSERSVTPSLQKSVDLLRSLAEEDRARAIQEPPAGREQRPEGIEEARLHCRERVEVARTAQPPNVGMAPHDPRRRARRIEQDRCERPAVPPGRRRGGVGRERRRAQAQANERLVDAGE